MTIMLLRISFLHLIQNVLLCFKTLNNQYIIYYNQPKTAFSWIEKNGGLCLEADYSYVSGTTKVGGTCQTTCQPVSGSEIKDFVDVTPNSVTRTKE